MDNKNFPAEELLSPRWLTEDEVLSMLKMSMNTFKKMREEMGLPYAVHGVKRYYNEADIQHMQVLSRRNTL